MKIETARHLIELADAGASIVIWKNLPETVPGWHNYAEREKELKSLLGDLQFVDGVATVGQGRIMLGNDLAALMAQTGIAREAMADHGLKFIRRKLPGEVVYFIANQSAKPVDEWIPIAAPCRSAVLMDPMTGALGKASARSKKSDPDRFTCNSNRANPASSASWKTRWPMNHSGPSSSHQATRSR